MYRSRTSTVYRKWRPGFVSGALLATVLTGCSLPGLHSRATPVRTPPPGRAYSADLHIETPIVPFEVDDVHVEMALVATSGWVNELDRANRLMHALFDPDRFGIEYAPIVTATARETLKTRKGNCLSIASVYIGLARGIGLTANYLDASARIHELFKDDEFIVNTGHITAVVQTNEGKLGLDFGDLLSGFGILRRMNDGEATAHFYNNRGYELIAMARQEKRPVDWKQVAASFAMATRAMPAFVPAWNNLGIVQSRRGLLDNAEAAYSEALRIDPEFAATHYNLGILYTAQNKRERALEAFSKAVELDDTRAHFHYRKAIALYNQGQRRPAIDALKRSLELDGDNARARAMLEAIHNPRKRNPEPGRKATSPSTTAGLNGSPSAQPNGRHGPSPKSLLYK